MFLKQFDDESNTVYNYRLEFINKYSNDNRDVSEKELIKLSKIVANIKYRGCKYGPSIFHKIKKYI
jgi:hypothetical protein